MSQYRRITARPLLFNDPKSAQLLEIEEGEPCLVVPSLKEAKDRGFVSNQFEEWAVETNLKRGYVLVLLRGVLRGVASEDIKNLR